MQQRHKKHITIIKCWNEYLLKHSYENEIYSLRRQAWLRVSAFHNRKLIGWKKCCFSFVLHILRVCNAMTFHSIYLSSMLFRVRRNRNYAYRQTNKCRIVQFVLIKLCKRISFAKCMHELPSWSSCLFESNNEMSARRHIDGDGQYGIACSRKFAMPKITDDERERINNKWRKLWELHFHVSGQGRCCLEPQ